MRLAATAAAVARAVAGAAATGAAAVGPAQPSPLLPCAPFACLRHLMSLPDLNKSTIVIPTRVSTPAAASVATDGIVVQVEQVGAGWS
mgnify:CR=1 FL=1